MKYIYLLLALLIFNSEVLSQQNPPKFSLYNVDTTKYPQITSNVYAVDGNNLRYPNLNVNDFDLFESNSQRDATMSLLCDTLNTPLPIAVCAVLDQSGSMKDRTPEGDTYWDWVKHGLRTFINQMVFVPPSVMAITSFGGEAFLRMDFQTTKPPLLSAIDQIPNEGATNYDEAFLNNSVVGGPNGAITVLRNGPVMLKRILIILTDGQPDKQPQTQKIIDSCWKNNITVFAINLKTAKNLNINNDLQNIVNATGGKAYLAGSKQELANIYAQIALEMQRNVDCRLTWTSFPGCTQQSRTRALRAVFRRPVPTLTWNGTYIAPATSLATPRSSVSTLTFTDPGTGGKQQKTIRIYAPSAIAIKLLNCRISAGQTFFRIVSISKPLTLNMQPNDSVDVLVEFTQDVIGRTHTGTLLVDCDICDISIPINVIIPIVKLESPKGGEIFSGCDSIHIRWSGVPEDEPVSLSYSTDNGIKWKGIATSATGLLYIWQIPIEHNQYKVRVQRSSCSIVSNAGSTGNDSLLSISYSPTRRQLGIGGTFENTLTYRTSTLLSSGNKDGVFGILNRNGSVDKLLSITGNNNETVSHVAADSGRKWLVCGTTNSQSISVSGVNTLALNNLSDKATFLTRIDSLGNSIWICAIADTSVNSVGECYPVSLHVRNDSIIIVQGYVRGKVTTISNRPSIPSFTLTVPDYNNIFFPFSAEIKQDGTILSLSYGFNSSYKHDLRTNSIETDNNVMYEVGSFSTTLQCGNTTVQPKGNSDGFVRIVNLNTVFDQSKTVFTVKKPNITFQRQLIGLPTTDVGKSVIPFPYPINDLENTGNLPVTLNALTFVGQDAQDFKIVNNVAPGIINANNGALMQIDYSPRLVNRRTRTTYLIVEGDCSPPAFTVFTADATFPKLTIDDVRFGEYRLKTVHHDTIRIVNSDPAPIQLTSIKTTGNTSGGFTWKVLFANEKDSVVQGNSTLALAVEFTPQQEQLDSIIFIIDAKGLSESLRSKAIGSGFLPKTRSRGCTFKTVTVKNKSTEIQTVVIYNTDSRVPLRVFSSYWNNNQSDASFQISTPINQKIIQPLDSIVLPVVYQPLTTGNHTAQYIFEHDAATGPDTLPRVTDTVTITADANDADLSTYSFTFPAMLSCEYDSTSFVLFNRSDRTTLDVTSVNITGDIDVFTVSPTIVSSLPANGGSQQFKVYYNPKKAESSTATIIISHTAGEPDTFKVNGQASDATLVFMPFETTGNAEDYRFIPIKARLSSSIPFLLDTITLSFTTNPSHAVFKKDTLALLYNDWIWKLDSNGTTFFLHGKHTGGGVPAGDIEFIQIPFYLFLSEKQTDTIYYNGIATHIDKCLHISGSKASISIEPVCFWTGRSIRLVNSMSLRVLGLNNNDITIQYTLPNNASPMLQLYNSIGELVYSQLFTDAKMGVNQVQIPANVLANGVHFCRLTVGEYTSVQQFFLSR